MFVSSDFIGTATLYRFDLPSNVPVPIATGLTFIEGGACSPSGLVYFAGGLGNWVTRWAQDGSGVTSIVPAAGQLESPEGLSFDAAGNLYLNQRDTPSGVGSGIWRLAGADPANTVTPIHPPYSTFGEGTTIVRGGAHAGALLFVDSSGSRVLRAEPPTAPATVLIDPSAMPAFPLPVGVTTNSAGEIFLATRDIVRRFDPEGVFLDDYVTGVGAAHFLDFDSAGDLYLADLTSKVWRIQPDRTRTLFASITNPVGLAICRCVNCSLAVRFDSWAASARRDGSVEVRFTTLSEEDTIGFLVERAAGGGGPFVSAGSAIAAHGPRQPYVFIDPGGGGAGPWYHIVELTSDGRGTMSPAFRAGSPSAEPAGRRRRR
jgi:sugar lactone lactonase YvrE